MPGRALGGVCRSSMMAVCVAALAGCGYHVGSMHPDDIHTVYVPIFKSQDYRRDLEFALTEEVVKAIERDTPYKVVKKPQADTQLTGTILTFGKSVYSINPDSDPRELTVTLTASVSWRDLRTGQLLVKGKSRGSTRELSEAVRYVPELGESITTASNRAVTRLAKRIVELMEVPW